MTTQEWKQEFIERQVWDKASHSLKQLKWELWDQIDQHFGNIFVGDSHGYYFLRSITDQFIERMRTG